MDSVLYPDQIEAGRRQAINEEADIERFIAEAAAEKGIGGHWESGRTSAYEMVEGLEAEDELAVEAVAGLSKAFFWCAVSFAIVGFIALVIL